MKTLEQARVETVSSISRVTDIYNDLMSKIASTTKDRSPVVNVNVEVGGQQITDIVTNTQINNSASGNQAELNRIRFGQG
jgi:citrate lyase synthetase